MGSQRRTQNRKMDTTKQTRQFSRFAKFTGLALWKMPGSFQERYGSQLVLVLTWVSFSKLV